MSDDTPLIPIAPGDQHHDEVAALVLLYGLSLNSSIDMSDPVAISRASAAAAVFAGKLMGSLIAAEVCGDGDRKRMADMATRNFRAGIEMGKRAGDRIKAGMPIMNPEGSA